ncbi:hypothetical protein AAV97_13210 [Acinetobacter sp. Ag2]|nr:hypothetical protein AAV97_13210 [Acinetobacter sp. Ag2]RSZ26662.1 hypothetical protein NDM229_012020 [Acinetobacter bereziniae]
MHVFFSILTVKTPIQRKGILAKKKLTLGWISSKLETTIETSKKNLVQIIVMNNYSNQYLKKLSE